MYIVRIYFELILAILNFDGKLLRWFFPISIFFFVRSSFEKKIWMVLILAKERKKGTKMQSRKEWKNGNIEKERACFMNVAWCRQNVPFN